MSDKPLGIGKMLFNIVSNGLNNRMGESTMNFRFAIMGAGNIAGKFCDAVSRVKECEVAAVSSKSASVTPSAG